MPLKTLLNRVHPLKSFVCSKTRILDADHRRPTRQQVRTRVLVAEPSAIMPADGSSSPGEFQPLENHVVESGSARGGAA
jgi:hypothetical protein